MNQIKIYCAVIAVLQFSLLTAVCQTKSASSESTTLPKIVNFDQPQTYQINARDLPKPYASDSAERSSEVVEQPKNAKLNLPKGFKINVFAEGNFENPRWLTLARNVSAWSAAG